MSELVVQHVQMMIGIKEKLHELVNLISQRPVVYLDIPLHGNVGDLLIMQGTLRFFEDNQVHVTNIFSVNNIDEKTIQKDTVIVFHGGGNLGDLYGLHQKHREDIINRYQDNKIIILPQTIYFESELEYRKSCDVFKQHSDVHLCVRDEKSMALAKEMSNNTYLLPDMAHQLYPIKYNAQNSGEKILFMKRMDKEAIKDDIQIKCDTQTDWSKFLERYKARVNFHIKLQKGLRLLSLNGYLSGFTTKIWIRCADNLVNESIALFAAHDVVITSRMHGHILACLMDKKNTVIDNSYGKNSSYIKVWTNPSPLVELTHGMAK